MAVARAEIGRREIAGPGDSARVVEYLRTTTLPRRLAEEDETPWCSGFVNWVFAQCGMERTKSASARSWLNWGEIIQEPRYGCVVIFTRNGGGHVAFYVADSGSHIHVLGGNQNDEVNVKLYPKERIIGYRWPKGEK